MKKNENLKLTSRSVVNVRSTAIDAVTAATANVRTHLFTWRRLPVSRTKP